MKHPLVKKMLGAEWLPLLILAIGGVGILSLISSNFFSTYNLFVMLRILSVTTLVALAQMVVIAIGQMNLAVGAIGGLVAILFGAMLEVYQLPIPFAALIGAFIGVACGTLSGWLIAWTKINGFVITLAMLSVFTGLNYGITESIPFYNMPETLKIWYDSYLGPIPVILFIPLIAACAVAIVLNHTRPGRHLLAVGGNPTAAELAGISVFRTTIIAHAMSGGLAALAGMVAVARLGTAEPSIGSNWLLASFAAPVIGGALLAGGHVSVVGTMIAVLIVVLLENGLILARTNPFYIQFFLGALILLTVLFNHWRNVTREAAISRNGG